jgi:hypothetical protein
MIDDTLSALQNSAFATWIQETAYPLVITAHSIGLALLVGLLVVIDLRVLGFAKGAALPALRKVMSVVWIGFWCNAISGAMLFVIDAKKDYHSWLFRSKLLLIALGLIMGARITSTVLKKADLYAAADADAPQQAKVLAVVSLLAWAGAIFVGRWLAYSTYGDIGVDE